MTNLIIRGDKLWSTIEIYTWSTIIFNLHQWFAREASLDLKKFVNDTFLFAKVSNKNTWRLDLDNELKMMNDWACKCKFIQSHEPSWGGILLHFRKAGNKTSLDLTLNVFDFTSSCLQKQINWTTNSISMNILKPKWINLTKL